MIITNRDVEEHHKMIRVMQDEKKSARVFCIGNGESRVGIDLFKYKEFGKIYGCNAIYRDLPNLCDVLTSVDHGMIHEIYHAGMAQKIPCYFRNWTKVPAHTYDVIIQDGLPKEELDKAIEQGSVITNVRGDSKEYVLHGANLKGVVNVLKKDGVVNKRHISQATIKVSWIQEPDYSHSLDDISKPRDHGWACGATAGLVAVKRENPCEVYLIGHDLHSHNEKINNIYKSTKHYTAKDNSPTPGINWINQWMTMFNWYPDINFYKVNRYNDGRDNVNGPIKEWAGIPNLKYIDYTTLDSML
jgi:hypothetical protein